MARYKLDLVGVQIRWDRRGTVRAGGCNFFCMGREMKIGNREQKALYTADR